MSSAGRSRNIDLTNPKQNSSTGCRSEYEWDRFVNGNAALPSPAIVSRNLARTIDKAVPNRKRDRHASCMRSTHSRSTVESVLSVDSTVETVPSVESVLSVEPTVESVLSVEPTVESVLSVESTCTTLSVPSDSRLSGFVGFFVVSRAAFVFANFLASRLATWAAAICSMLCTSSG